MSEKVPKDLTAIEVRVGDKTKHIGKVGLTPYSAHPAIRGKRILYKEVDSQDLYCRVTRSYSIDRVAMDYAYFKCGAEFVVIHCFDVPAMLIVMSKMVIESPISNLGEREQYRFHPTKCEVIEGDYSIKGWWTNRIVVVDDLLENSVLTGALHRPDQMTLTEFEGGNDYSSSSAD